MTGARRVKKWGPRVKQGASGLLTTKLDYEPLYAYRPERQYSFDRDSLLHTEAFHLEYSGTFPDRVLDFQFDGQRITLATLVEAATHVLSILRDVDARATEREGGALDWVITDIRSGSAMFEVVAEPNAHDTPIWAPEVVVQRFKTGLKHVIETGERPEYFGDTAMRHTYELTTLFDVNGIVGLRVGKNADSIALTEWMRKPAKDALEGRYRAIGSVEGRIDGMSAHAPPYACTVYSLLTGEAVRCTFGPELLDEVYRNFRKRVIVRGTFNTRANGEVTSMRISDVERLPDADELPSVDDVIGILAHGG